MCYTRRQWIKYWMKIPNILLTLLLTPAFRQRMWPLTILLTCCLISFSLHSCAAKTPESHMVTCFLFNTMTTADAEQCTKWYYGIDEWLSPVSPASNWSLLAYIRVPFFPVTQVCVTSSYNSHIISTAPGADQQNRAKPIWVDTYLSIRDVRYHEKEVQAMLSNTTLTWIRFLPQT